jgi:hypothetical protein
MGEVASADFLHANVRSSVWHRALIIVAETPAVVLAISFTCGAIVGWFINRM